ncbi:MAG: M48 family metallopeptidase [Pyrinomonadaceae bacterium]
MGKVPSSLVSLFLIFTLIVSTAYPQREIGIPIKKQGAYVLQFKEPYENLIVDIDDNNFIETESLELPVSTRTRFVNRANRPIDRDLVRPGMRITIEGERFGGRIVASVIKVETPLEKWEDEAKGYLEGLEGDKAWIDGKAVKLAPGAVVRGVDEWKGKTFASFDEMQLGSEVWLKGTRRADGLLYASEGKTEPNLFTDTDRALKTATEKGLRLPANLTGGRGTIDGKEVKFVNNLRLQTYVTAVGNRLIPRYYKDQPNDNPGKVTFRFAVIEDDSFNAFATPDGFVAIHTGLLKQIRNEAQLATVLGHEIAHVTHEHSRKTADDQWKQGLIVLGGALASRAMGGKDGGAGLLTSLVFATAFDRHKEDQADRVGLYYMVRAGYDPREASKVWREIVRNTKPATAAATSGQALQSLYSSHPSAQQRLKYLNRAIAYSYHDMDFGNAKIGEREYTNAMNGAPSTAIGGSLPASRNINMGGAGSTLVVRTPRDGGGSNRLRAVKSKAQTLVRGLPAIVNAYLSKTYPRWGFATASTSCVDEFRKSRVEGDYNGDGVTDYTVKFSTARKGFIIAFVSRAGGFTPHILESGSLSEMREQGLASAVKGESYGEIVNDNFDRVTKYLTTDAPVGGTCSASAYLYVYSNGTFRRAFTSD